ncbi:MAG: HAD family hydrolase [Kyrpidia tusciae]|nr:HAD family hydrolase [Kyrpidia tusciae]MBE3553314.1 HAD family hydrolase [Kyrpidia tusciae]
MPDIRMIVYDLDGTLYRDRSHFRRYCELLAAGAPRPSAFERDWEYMEDERHPLRVGMFFNGRTGQICGPKGLMTWEGEVVRAGSAFYDDLVNGVEQERDLGDWLYIGDLWWSMIALAAWHRVPPERLRESFLATRAYMMEDAVPLRTVPGLKEFIQARNREGVVQILATNSPEPDSRAIIGKLGLKGLFHVCSFVTGKPAGLLPRLREWAAEFGASLDEVLMVGDNYRNDVVPARRGGCRTFFLDPHRVPHPVHATYHERRIESLFVHWNSPQNFC